MAADNLQLMRALADEAERIEEDALHSMKGHLNAGVVWSRVHLGLGLPAAVLAAWAGIDAFSDSQVMTSVLALLSASFATTVTFLGPQQKATEHKNAGREFNALKNRSRRFRQIYLQDRSIEDLKSLMDELCEKRDSLNSMSPDIPRWAYEKAKRDIDAGLADYRVDKGFSHDG